MIMATPSSTWYLETRTKVYKFGETLRLLECMTDIENVQDSNDRK